MAQAKLCHRILSGIQPTGIPHLGNYFGTLTSWIKIANERRIAQKGVVHECQEPIFCIADVHALYSPPSQTGVALRDNILMTTASLLALGLDPNRCILFRRSDVLQHSLLGEYFYTQVANGRLSNMIQFKEKSKQNKVEHTGIFVYPVLQAADILLYKANFVPVGEDQQQHIELTRDIAKKYNSLAQSMGLKEIFPIPVALLNEEAESRRIMSLRDPGKKMSKSDVDKRSFIGVVDEPEVILEKCKKAQTDSVSAVYFDKEKRPGVSNLLFLYHLTTGETIESICDQYKGVQMSDFKLRLADCLVEKFRHPREEFKRLMADRNHLKSVLELGKCKASTVAQATMNEVNVVAELDL